MDKVMPMREAISRCVRTGDTVFLSGMLHGGPAAAIHEIVRQRIDHLTVVELLTNFAIMLGEGLIDKLICAHAPLNEKESYAVRKAKATDRVPVLEEYSHFGINMGLLAGQMGVPYLPTRVQLGTDMLKYNKNLKETRCPFSDEKLIAVKAIVPDVGIIHVQRADAKGNAQKWGTLGADVEGINASRKVIVVTEKIVDSEVIGRDPNRTLVPGFRVNAVVEQPFGAFPLHLAGCYDGDSRRVFQNAMREEKSYEAYMRDFVYGVRDWNEYLDKIKKIQGEDYFDSLLIKHPVLSEPVVFGYQ